MISIDGYTDIVRIGRGGLGDVYRAVRSSTGGTVAIKVLRDVSDQSVAWHRTRRELAALVALGGHAHVIQPLELLELDEGPALVMEYAPGGSIADLMETRDSTMSVAETALVGRQTAAALVAAHEQGIVHRDIKPQNLLIDTYGQIKLCDFGIASLTRSDEFRARTSAISMRYASPEDLDDDLDDDLDVGSRSDIYSLGATLLHLARGAPPTMKQRLAPWVAPDCDDSEAAGLDAIVASCLRPEPSERPTATTLVDDLEQFEWGLHERTRALVLDTAVPPTEGESVSDGFRDDSTVLRAGRVPPPARPAPIPDTPSRRNWIVGGLIAVAVVALAVGAVVLWPGGGDEISTSARASPTPPVAFTTSPPESVAPIELTQRPDGMPDVASDVWPYGPVGSCLIQQPELDELVDIRCDQAHDLQRFAIDDLDQFAADANFDADDVRDAVGEACSEAFSGFVGHSIDDSRLEIASTSPSAATWDGGDRRYQCLLGISGQRITDDARNSRW